LRGPRITPTRPTARKSPRRSRPSTRTSTSESSSNTLQNGTPTYKRFAGSMASAISRTPLFIRSMGRSLGISRLSCGPPANTSESARRTCRSGPSQSISIKSRLMSSSGRNSNSRGRRRLFWNPSTSRSRKNSKKRYLSISSTSTIKLLKIASYYIRGR
jgi:hypothetical protein